MPAESQDEAEGTALRQRVAAFSELVRAGDDDSRKLVMKAHPELLTPWASENIGRVLKSVRDNGGWDSAEYLDAHRDLLLRWRDEGPDAALAEYAHHVGRVSQIDRDLPRASVDSMVSEMFSLTVPTGGGSSPGHVDGPSGAAERRAGERPGPGRSRPPGAGWSDRTDPEGDDLAGDAAAGGLLGPRSPGRDPTWTRGCASGWPGCCSGCGR